MKKDKTKSKMFKDASYDMIVSKRVYLVLDKIWKKEVNCGASSGANDLLPQKSWIAQKVVVSAFYHNVHI